MAAPRISQSSAEGNQEGIRAKKKSKFNNDSVSGATATAAAAGQNMNIMANMNNLTSAHPLGDTKLLKAMSDQQKYLRNAAATVAAATSASNQQNRDPEHITCEFQYLNPFDKFQPWRDSHIESLECFVVFCESLLANQTLSGLRLAGVQFCDVMIDELCETLRLIPSLKSLDLSNLSLDALSWLSVSRYVGASKVLSRLNLSRSVIREDSMRDFFNCFRTNTTIQEVNLSACKIEYAHMNIFLRLLARNPNIQKVLLSNRALCDENAEGVAAFLSDCRKIDLLDISKNSFTKAFFDRLNRNLSTSSYQKAKVHTLNLAHNLSSRKEGAGSSFKLIETILSILKKLKGVHSLNLSDNFIETEDIKRLNSEALRNKKFPLIVSELDLSRNLIERNFPECFMRHLKVVNLRRNLLSLSSMEVIARTLRDEETKWEVLDISDNRIGNSGLEILINYLKENTRLKELYCSSNEIEGGGMISIIINNERMNLTKIDLSENKFSLNSVISYLNSLKNPSLNRILLRNFEETMKLTVSKSTLINDSKIVFDSPFSLDLEKSATLATHILKGFDRHLPKLLSLNLRDCVTLTESDVARLANLVAHSNTLSSLVLEGVPLGDLKEDCLNEFGESFGKNRCLKELNLRRCRLKNRFVNLCRNLGNITSLEILDVSSNELTDLIAGVLKTIISKCFHLSDLNLSYNSVGNGCLISIIQGLKGNSSLRSLSMASTELSAGDLLTLSQLIEGCGHLKELDLSFNKLLDVSFRTASLLGLKSDGLIIENRHVIDSVDAHALKSLIESNAVSSHLHFNHVRIPTVYVSRLFEAIPSMPKLTELCMEDIIPSIDAERLIVLFRALASHTKLAKIKLRKFTIPQTTTTPTAEALAALIVSLKQLSKLSVIEISLDLPAITCIAKAIRNNQGITKIRFIDNDLRVEAANKLAAALKDHSGLRAIHVIDNPISEEGFEAITRAIVSTNHVRDVRFTHSKILRQQTQLMFSAITKRDNEGRFLNMQRLVLRKNKLGTNALVVLLKHLKSHPSLVHLDLSENTFADELMDNLKMFLDQNTGLKELVLQNCEIESLGFASLSKGACHNKVLEYLDLSENTSDGDDAMEIFARFLHETHIRLLVVSGNNISNQGNSSLYTIAKSRLNLFIVNDWMSIHDDLAIELLQHLANIYQFSSAQLNKCIARHNYTQIDFSHGLLTDRFCTYLTMNLSRLHHLETLNLQANPYISQTGMKHVFTAVFDTQHSRNLSLIELLFSSYTTSEDLMLFDHIQSNSISSWTNANAAYYRKQSKKSRDKKNQSSTAISHLANQPHQMNSRVIMPYQQSSQSTHALSIREKFTVFFERRLQFVNESLSNSLEYKFDYANLEKLNLLKHEGLFIFLLSASFIVQLILASLPFIDQSEISRVAVFVVSLLSLIVEMLVYCVYLLYSHRATRSQKKSSIFQDLFFHILPKLKFFDVFLALNGFSRRVNFIITNYVAIFYFTNDFEEYELAYTLCLIVKAIVYIFYVISPIYEWGFKRCCRNSKPNFSGSSSSQSFMWSSSILASNTKSKQFLDIGERLSMAFGLALIEQIFALFNPGTSSVLQFKKRTRNSSNTSSNSNLQQNSNPNNAQNNNNNNNPNMPLNAGPLTGSNIRGKTQFNAAAAAPRHAMFNVWNKKIFEIVNLVFSNAPLFVMYILLFPLFTRFDEKRILILGFISNAFTLLFSGFVILTNVPTYIQQADFNAILNIRKFQGIQSAKSKTKAMTVNQLLQNRRNYIQQNQGNMATTYTSKMQQFQQLQYAQSSIVVPSATTVLLHASAPRNQTSTLFHRLAAEGVIVSDFNARIKPAYQEPPQINEQIILENEHNSFMQQQQQQQPQQQIPMSQQQQSLKQFQQVMQQELDSQYIEPIEYAESLEGSIPIEADHHDENEIREFNHQNFLEGLKKIKSE